MKRITRQLTLVLTAIALSSGSALVRAQEHDKDNQQRDKAAPHTEAGKGARFITEAAQGGLMEVKIGQLAIEKGQSTAVKDLGRRLVQDHSKANEELKRIAQKKGVELPQELDQKHSKMVDRLSMLSGEKFDQAFAQYAVKDHQKDIKTFEMQSKADDADIKAFASKTLPALREHLRMAQALPGADRAGAKDQNGPVINEAAGAQKPTDHPDNAGQPNSRDKSQDSNQSAPNGNQTPK